MDMENAVQRAVNMNLSILMKEKSLPTYLHEKQSEVYALRSVSGCYSVQSQHL